MKVIWVNHKGEVEDYELIEQDYSDSAESMTGSMERREEEALSLVMEQSENKTATRTSPDANGNKQHKTPSYQAPTFSSRQRSSLPLRSRLRNAT